MRDDICTIPISEVFEQTDGCPFCRMRNKIEDQVVDYILGAAMMEPDVRIKSNELGYCGTHLKMMMTKPKRLPLALILETHLDSLNDELFKKKLIRPSAKKQAYKTARIEQSCFVCDRMEWGLTRLLQTVVRTYYEQYDFRDMFKNQEYICLPHYKMLMQAVEDSPLKSKSAKLCEDAAALAGNHLAALREDVHLFTKMFDYRNSGEEGEMSDEVKLRVKDSIDRTFEYLTSRGDV